MKEFEFFNNDNAFHLFKIFINDIIFSIESFKGLINHFQNEKFEFKLNSKDDVLNIQLFRMEDNKKNESKMSPEKILILIILKLMKNLNIQLNL